MCAKNGYARVSHILQPSVRALKKTQLSPNIYYTNTHRIQFGVNTALYPPTSGLFGAQAVLHEPGTVPDLDLSAIFVSPGQATIITLRRTQTRHLPPPKGQGGETLSWDAAPSLLSIDPSIPQASDTIVLGFMYRELAVLDIEEIELSTVTQFLGILAGVIGVLLGLDVLSVSILVVGFAFALVRKRRKRSANVRRAGAGVDEAAGLIGNNGSNNNISSNNNNISTNNNSSNNYGHGVGGHNDGVFNGQTTSHGDYGDQPGAGRFIGGGGGGGVELQQQQLQQQQQQYDYGGLQSDHRPGAFSHAPISSPSPPNTHSPFGAGGASRLPPGAPIDERPPLPAIHGSGGSGGGGFRASPQQPYQPHQPLPQYDTDQPNLPGSARDEPGAGDPRVW
jgi:hypothetical protein